MLLFFPYLILSHLDFFRRRDPDTLRRFCDGLYTIYAAGLIGYVLIPAAGPYVAMADRVHQSARLFDEVLYGDRPATREQAGSVLALDDDLMVRR